MRDISKKPARTRVLSDRLSEDKLNRPTNIDFPISVNLVVTDRCNYSCRFCFGKYRTFCGHIDDSRILELPGLLADAGAQKITFEGGEPLLHPGLSDLIVEAKGHGLVTGLVTNGYLMTEIYLKELADSLDWLGLSIDSASEQVEIQLGRGFGDHVKRNLQVVDWAHDLNIPLKINSVITKLNYDEDLTELIKRLAPARFKAFQMLRIKGENDLSSKQLEITSKEFGMFVHSHIGLINDGIDFVPETQEDMTGSYIMMLPNGRFFNNIGHIHTYGKDTVFEVGVKKAFKDIHWNVRRFLKRGGLYDWDIKKRDIHENTYDRSTRVNGQLSDNNMLEKEGEKNGI